MACASVFPYIKESSLSLSLPFPHLCRCIPLLFAGTSYTMIGRDDCSANLGIIPCAISWLFKLINKKKDRTWANISVSVSAVEVCGETEVIRDLLSDVESGDCKDTNKLDVYLLEDPVCGIQVAFLVYC